MSFARLRQLGLLDVEGGTIKRRHARTRGWHEDDPLREMRKKKRKKGAIKDKELKALREQEIQKRTVRQMQGAQKHRKQEQIVKQMQAAKRFPFRKHGGLPRKTEFDKRPETDFKDFQRRKPKYNLSD